MTDLRLVIFDVDGTLVDSQAHILASMAAAFERQGLVPPDRAATLSIVGLSLPVAMVRLAPERPDLIDALVEGYKAAFARLRLARDTDAQSPLYPGAQEVLQALRAQPETLLAIATGKSRRGLDHLMDLYGWAGLFQSVQCADDHPSKPHPSMVDACLGDTGVAAARAVIVGDTSYDMEMGRAAGVAGIGVAWGYHGADMLLGAGAVRVIDRFEDLPGALAEIWRTR